MNNRKKKQLKSLIKKQAPVRNELLQAYLDLAVFGRGILMVSVPTPNWVNDFWKTVDINRILA